jgi:hypothetical protein
VDEPITHEEYMASPENLTTLPEPLPECEHPVDITRWLRREPQASRVLVSRNTFDPVAFLLQLKQNNNFEMLNKISMIMQLSMSRIGTNRQRASIDRIYNTLQRSQGCQTPEAMGDSNTVGLALSNFNCNVSRPFYVNETYEPDPEPYTGDFNDEE